MQRMQSSGAGKYGLLGFGLLWSLISCCVLVPTFGSNYRQYLNVFNGEASIGSIIGTLAFPVLFGGIFLGVGLLVTLLGLQPIIAATRVTKPEIQISNTNLRSGEPFTLSYQQGFKSGIDVNRLTVQLILRESATYRRGTDTVTVTHDHLVQNFEIANQHFEAGQSLAQNFQWGIPRGAMHSFEASRNRLRWLIKINVEMRGWPNYTDEFPLRVLPELA